MILPLFFMMRLVQTVPLSLLTFAAFPDEDLRRGRMRSCLVSVSYMVLSCAAMALLSPMSSQNGQRNIIAREQLAVLLYRYAGSPAAPDLTLDFTDAGEVSGFAQDAVRWAVGQGILSGKGNGILDPKGQVTRAQVAAMLLRYLKINP